MDPFEADSFASTRTQARRNTPHFEASVLALLAFGLGVATRPQDPMSVAAVFPWPLLAVLLAGLRYGFPIALLTAAILHVATYLYSVIVDPSIWPVPFAYSVGFAIVAVIAGEYREGWGRRLTQVERSNAYRQARLEEFTGTYHVLKLSHDRLEQDNAGNQTSLRSSLLTVRGLFVPGSDLHANGPAVLDLYRRHCAVVSGAFHVVQGGAPQAEASAQVGRVNDTVLDDVLVRDAMRTMQVASVNPANPDSMVGRTQGDPLIVVPFFDSFRTLHGLMVVTELPFFSYTERTLQLMAILGGKIADFTRDRHTYPADLDPESASFASEIIRSLEYVQEYGLPTTLVALRFGDQTAAPAYISTIDAQSRGLDRVLAVGDVEQRSALLIMPLTGSEEYEQFLNRFESYISEAHGAGPAALQIETSHLLITSTSGAEDIAQFMTTEAGDGAQPLAEALRNNQTHGNGGRRAQG